MVSFFKRLRAALLASAVVLPIPVPVQAQVATPGVPLIPMGYCQVGSSSLSAAVGLTESTCALATFTGTGNGTTLTVSSVTGILSPGLTLAGTGVPGGTTIIKQISLATGVTTFGGAGTYQTSVATTSSTASLTAGGIPTGAFLAYLQAESANIRYRDDGVAPTTTVGALILSSNPGILYSGTLSALQFIGATGSPLLDVTFYRAPAP